MSFWKRWKNWKGWKKGAALLSAAGMLVFCHGGEAQAAPEVSASSSVLMEAQTGKIVCGRAETERRPMASTTKIMSALLLLESGGLDEEFTVDPEAIKVEGSSMGLQEGDIVTKRALAIGMLLPSGNDAANVTAVKLAGSQAAFADLMNQKAEEIGMKDTHFVTPSGLEDPEHYSTAYDMALLTREALKNEDFRAICSQSTMQLSFGNPPYQRWLKNSNKLLGYYQGCIGVKTGFTDEAGRCLVSAAEKNGVTLICVTLHDPNDWADHAALLDYGFTQVKNYRVNPPGNLSSVPVVGGTAERAGLQALNPPQIALMQEDMSKISTKTILPEFVYAPVKNGDEVGAVEYYLDGVRFASLPLIVAEDVPAPEEKPGIWEQISSWLKHLFQPKDETT